MLDALERFVRVARRPGWNAVALLSLVACGAGAVSAPVPGGSLKVAMRGDPGSLDCHAVASSIVSMAVSPAYSTLLRFNTDNFAQIVGGVARSWSVSPDRLVYTFTLEPGIKFHDGSPLGAEDVRATYDRLRNPPIGVTSVRQNLFTDIKQIDVADPLTVVFTLSAPNPAMLTVFANPWNCLYSARRLAAEPNYPAKTVMGSGPFRLVEYTPGNRMVYEKFPSYFRKGLPYLDRLEFAVVSNAGVVPALSSGQLDADFYTFSAPIEQQIAKARGAATVFQTSPMSTMSFVAFNERRPLLADVRVRQALTLAIDRATGEANLPRLVAIKGHDPVYRANTQYALPPDKLKALPGYGSDIAAAREQARKLLSDAGSAKSRIVLVVPSVRDPFESLGVFLADAWRRVGVDVEVRALDGPAYQAARVAGDFDALVDWNSPVSLHPIEVLEKYAPGSANNAGGSKDPELAALYQAVKREADPDRQVALTRSFEERLLDQAHVAPLYWASRTVALPSDLRGWKGPPNFYLGMDLAELWRDPGAAR